MIKFILTSMLLWSFGWGKYALIAEERLGEGIEVSALVMESSGKRIALGCSDGGVRIVGIPSGRVELILRGHASPVSALAFLDGETLLSGDRGGEVRRWNLKLQEGEVWPERSLEARGAVRAIAAQEGFYAATFENHTLEYQDGEGKKRSLFYPRNFQMIGWRGSSLYLLGWDRRLRVVEAQSGKEILEREHSDEVLASAYCAYRDDLLVADTGRRVWRISFDPKKPSQEVGTVEFSPSALACDPFEKGVWIGGSQGEVIFWGEGGVKEFLGEMRSGGVRGLFAPGGGILVGISWEGRVVVWKKL